MEHTDLSFFSASIKKKSEPGQLIEIIGTLESVKGDLCVRAKGTFAAPALTS